MSLFSSDFVSSRDEIGPFQDLIGIVLSIQPKNGSACVQSLEHGTFNVYSEFLERYPEKTPQINYWAKIRIYNSGGGFYPDNQLLSWSKYEENLNHA